MMYKIFFFITCVICVINGQFDLDDVCTFGNKSGICTYEHRCNYAQDLRKQYKHPPECSYEGNILIVCCPEDYESGVLSRYFEGTEGVIDNGSVQCHYNGYLPMICCPIRKQVVQDTEPEGCEQLPSVVTPSYSSRAHTIAWEKCVANEPYINECDEISLQRHSTCAIPESSQRISGGEPAAPREFPHMAVLGRHNDIPGENDIVWQGGGSLISDRFILTAGHVLLSKEHQIRYALLGSLDKTDVRSGELYTIIRLIPHDLYVSTKKDHDIALVQLDRQVIFSKFIRPICLPVPGIDPSLNDDTRLVAGWGQAGHKLQATNLLQKAIISIVSATECDNRTLTAKGFVWNDETMICARGARSRQTYADTCPGDSGGPLMYKVTNKEFDCNYVVDGVVSWGGVCGVGIGAAYTRVSAYLDWIVQKVWPEELNSQQDFAY